MQNEKRLTLDDFKLTQIESGNEIEKMLGEEAAACHRTSCPDGVPCIDILDIQWD